MHVHDEDNKKLKAQMGYIRIRLTTRPSAHPYFALDLGNC